MEIIPAIDLRGGRCVRLYQGDYSREMRFSDDPLQVALKWQSQGAPRLHIIDLDGAAGGEPQNLEVARQIYAQRPLPIVLLTAYGDQGLVERATDLPIMAYLMKPVNEQELLATLQVVRARFEEQQEALRQAVELEDRLATRKLVERAKGVLMEQESLSEEQAYRRIQRQARQERCSMRQVAEAILRSAR